MAVNESFDFGFASFGTMVFAIARLLATAPEVYEVGAFLLPALALLFFEGIFPSL